MSGNHRYGPVRRRGPSAHSKPRAPCPGRRRGLTAGPSDHTLARAASRGAPGACTWPAGREALRPAAGPLVWVARHARTTGNAVAPSHERRRRSSVPPPSTAIPGKVAAPRHPSPPRASPHLPEHHHTTVGPPAQAVVGHRRMQRAPRAHHAASRRLRRPQSSRHLTTL
jgi:hypothetical protein